MSLFRSAQMKYYTMHVPKEDTYDVISRLAEHNFVQFIDKAATIFHKPYMNHLKRCDDVIGKIDLLMKKIYKQKIQLPDVPNVEFVFQNHRQYLKKHQMNALAFLDHVQADVDQNFERLQKTNRSLVEYGGKINELQDYKYLLFKAREVFHSSKSPDSTDIDFDKHSLEQLRLVNVSGIIYSKDLLKFTKMIFRVTKGNSILYTFNIPREYEDNQDDELRTAFICVVQTGGILLTKINRICQSFGAKRYKLPTNRDQIFGKIKQIQDSITDTKQLLVMAQKNYQQDLRSIIGTGQLQCAKYDAYRIIAQRQAIIFTTMNLMEEGNNIMLGGIWVPTQKSGLLFNLLPSFVSIREVQGASLKPPTFFEINTFTAPFQQIVDTYGVPRYQEVNPALYAIPIFPFLFGVMFGDIGHGGVLLAFALWLTLKDQAKKILPDVYPVRYLILMMGVFSFYSGWIYNQFFSIPLNLFGSCYGQAGPEQYAVKEEGCVYPFGFDPKWIRASNQLNYFNSFKMKFAVIIGVLQMSFAILLKMMNSVHFRNYLDLFFEWIPQQVFFFSTFGYMCVLIIYKWTIPWGIQADSALAPSIIGQMIALPLQLGSTEGKPLWDQQSQQSLQYVLLIIALICVPMMLIPKPLIIWIQMMQNQPTKKKTHAPVTRAISDNSQNELNEDLMGDDEQLQEDKPPKAKSEHRISQTSKGTAHHDDHEEHDISEIAVHQIIQTIQFVLGSISNTASYLRLWALSLAHGQLSKVFLQKTIGGGIESGNILIIVVGMWLFFNITLGVIMGMDSMECFLHALRLQWVEFQNKFFKADGWKFTPLAFVKPIQDKAYASRVFD